MTFYNSLIAGALVVCVLSFDGAQAETIKLDLSNEYPAQSITGVADTNFAELVKEKSNGEVEIVPNFGGALGYKSKDHLNAVSDGAIAIGDTYVGVFGGFDPIFLLPSLPFLANSVDETRKLYEVAADDYKAFFEKNGQIVLFVTPWPPNGVWAKKPLDTPGSLDGVSIRAYDKTSTTMLESLGARPTTLSWADVVPALSTGSIDAVLTTAESGANASFWDYMTDFTEIYSLSVLSFTHMNKAVFDGLSKPQQQAVLDAAAEVQEDNWGAVDARVKDYYAKLKDHNVTVHPVTDEAYVASLRHKADTIVAAWVKDMGERGQEILAEYRKKLGNN